MPNSQRPRRNQQKGVLGCELDRPHRTLDRVRVHFDTPVIKVERQAIPMAQRVTQSLRRVALLRKVIKLCLKPLFQGCGQRPGMRLPARATLGIRSAAEGLLDRVEASDALEGLTGNRSGR